MKVVIKEIKTNLKLFELHQQVDSALASRKILHISSSLNENKNLQILSLFC